MRVFNVSDMEGLAGIPKREQENGGTSLDAEGRALSTEQINAPVRGARAAGATEIVVKDCHGAGGDCSFNSLLPERLDAGCEFVVQHEWTEYTGFLEEGCDAALFVGMHAKAGTSNGLLSHTVSSSSWTNLSFNGVSVGESGINAALCGHWGCPVLLVTGDDAVCREARALLGDGLTTVAVKSSLGRYSARHVPPLRARQMIEEGATAALADLKAVAPYVPSSPVEITVEFTTPDHVEKYRFVPGVEIVDGRTIISRAADWWTAWRQFYFIG
jgi:D-amino peptidase